MTKEELEKEAEEYYEDETEGTFQICEDCYWFADAVQTAYVDSAEPREKQIQALGERCLQLQKDKGRLTDELTEKDKQIEELKEKSGCSIARALRKENKELEAQIEKMKCCGNCKYYQFQNDARYYTCTKDGKRNGKNYRSCEFNLEKWELGR